MEIPTSSSFCISASIITANYKVGIKMLLLLQAAIAGLIGAIMAALMRTAFWATGYLK